MFLIDSVRLVRYQLVTRADNDLFHRMQLKTTVKHRAHLAGSFLVALKEDENVSRSLVVWLISSNYTRLPGSTDAHLGFMWTRPRQ